MRLRLVALPLAIGAFIAAAFISVWLLAAFNKPVWAEMNEGLPRYGIVTGLAFDAVDANLVYAAAYYKHGVYRSEDGGRTWRVADEGLDGAAVYALAPSPTRAGVVYAGAADGVYLSVDAARSWQRLPGPEKPVYALLIPPNSPSHIYAGSYSQLFVSEDEGESWTTLRSGLEGATLLSFALESEDARSLLAGTSGAGLLRTTDGGATWTQVLSIKEVIAAVARRSGDGMLFVRAEDKLLSSPDRGRTWETAEPLPGGRRPLSISNGPDGKNNLLVGSEGDGVLTSADGGKSWRALGMGLERGRVTAIATSSGDPLRLVAGTPHGVFYSHDGGLRWEQGRGIGRPVTRGLTQVLSDGRLLVGTTDGVFEWAGSAWRQLGVMQADTLVLSIARAPTKPETLYAGTWGDSVQRSVDGGQTWQLSAGGHYSRTIIPTILVDPDDARRVYARIEYDRLILSDDGGDTWRSSDVGLTGVTVQSMAIAPGRASLLYAGTDHGVYRSIDRGATWSRMGEPPWSGSTLAIVVDPRNVDSILVGTTSGVFRSQNGGQTWTAAKGLEDVTVSALAFYAVNPERGFAGTRLHGVYKTADAGMTWQPLANGLPYTMVNALVVDEQANRLVAATEDGVFTLSVE